MPLTHNTFTLVLHGHRTQLQVVVKIFQWR